MNNFEAWQERLSEWKQVNRMKNVNQRLYDYLSSSIIYILEYAKKNGIILPHRDVLYRNANLNSNLLGLSSSHKSKVHNLSPTIIHQNSYVNINQTGQSNSKFAVTNSSGSRVNTKSNIGISAIVNSNLLNLHSPSNKSVSHGALLVKQKTKTNVNQTGQTSTGINVTNSPHSNVNSKSNVNNNANVNTLLSSSHKFGSSLDLTQKSKTNVNQAGETSTGINVTNSPHSNVNSKSNVNNNANVNSNLNSNVNNPSRYIGSLPSPSSSLSQNTKTTINQGAQNNANINVNNRLEHA